MTGPTPIEGVKDAVPVPVEITNAADLSTPAPARIPHESPWTAGMVTALFSGLTGLLGAAAAMMVTVASIRKENTKQVEEVKAQVIQVHDLVNSTDSARLEKIARLYRRIAVITKTPQDLAEADAAEHDATEKAAATKLALETKTEADKAAAAKEVK